MRHTSVIQVDLSAIDHNMSVLRRAIGPSASVCPVVKADAYGLGAPRVAKRLAASGAAMLAVYTLEQAAELVRVVPGVPILVLMPVWEIDRTDELYRALIAGRLNLTVHGLDHLEGVIHIAERFGAVLPLHVEVDTGMSRGGAGEPEVPAILKRICNNRWTRVAGLFTHLASAAGTDGSADRQRERFERVIHDCQGFLPRECLLHAANTDAALRSGRFHFNMIRVGLAWAGLGGETLPADERFDLGDQLRPALTWSSRIVHVKDVGAGQPVGYGGTWTAGRDSRIGLIPVGYADGYPTGAAGADADPEPAMVAVRITTSGGSRRAFAPVVGAVNMDQITVDLTDLAEGTVGVGSDVELISPDPSAANHVSRLAARAGILPHALLSGINPRIRRMYLVRPASDEAPAAQRSAAALG